MSDSDQFYMLFFVNFSYDNNDQIRLPRHYSCDSEPTRTNLTFGIKLYEFCK